MALVLTYFKRFRMEIGLTGRQFHSPLREGYWFVPWEASLADVHAETKYFSFRHEIDAVVFPCLGDLEGCRRLIAEIARRDGFLPQATWLVARGDRENPEYCGTIQGIRQANSTGAIQNLGVIPARRDEGLGTSLLFQALSGFQKAGLRRACLEVTAQNDSAIRLYQRMGFSRCRTVYKVVEAAYA
jgi:GNAT superfamily N-acetyltransferase